MLMFSTHSMKYIWYSTKKSKYPLYSLIVKVVEYDQEIPQGKYRNHTVQTRPQHREEEPQNTSSHKSPEDSEREATQQDDCKTRTSLSTA